MATVQPREPAVPELIAGRYLLRAELSRGSCATVYSALDQRFQRAVVVKLFDPSVAADPGLRARFVRQAARAARLRHPQIAALLDAGFARDDAGGERAFVVTEPAGALTLRDLLALRRRLAPRAAVRLARQVAAALAYAHRRGVVHADLKPENVVVDERGEAAKLVDCALSFVVATTGAVTPETLARRAAYLAPEQVLGERVGPSADVYGLGALLYELVVGRPPFVGPTPQATAERRVAEHALPPGLFDPSVPPQLEAVIGRALERSPGRRWLSIEAFDRELARLEAETLEPQPVDDRFAAAERPLERPRFAWPAALGQRLAVAVALLAMVAAPLLLVQALARDLRLPGLAEVAAELGLAGGQVEVPNLAGLSLIEAEVLARARGLTLRVADERVTERTPKGVVLQQSLVPGPRRKTDQPLLVAVSAGVKAPDVRGQPLAQAEAKVAAAGWSIGRVDRGPHPGQPTGTVVLQYPAPDVVIERPVPLALAVAE